jgi:excisionase family DNA binding protein
MQQQTKSLWRYADLAEYLKVSEDKLRRSVMNRAIPFTKIGRVVRFDPEEIDAWLKESCTHHPEE